MSKIMKKSLITICLILICFLASASIVNIKAKDTINYNTQNDKSYYNTKNSVETYLNKKFNDKTQGYFKNNNKLTSNENNPKIISDVVNSFVDASKEDLGDTEALFDVASSIITVVASYYGLQGVSETIFKEIKSALLTPPEDNVELLQQHLDQRLDDIELEMNEIEENLDELFEELTLSTDQIINELYKIFEYEDARNNLQNFFTKRSGSFNYPDLKEYIFGDSKSTNGYYGALIDYLNNNPDAALEEKKVYFDKLYTILMSPNYNTANIFKDYLYSDTNEIFKSIQQYYYDYLLVDKNSTDYENAETLAILFMLDLYNTQTVVNNLILACNIFQSAYLKSKINGVISSREAYTYGSGELDFITYEQINHNFEKIINEQDKLRAQFIKDLVYILNIDDSYSIMQNNKIYYVSDKSSEHFGNVKVGQKIYMNKFSNAILELFDLDASVVNYYWYDGNKFLEDNEGILDVSNSYSDLKCVVYYEDVKLYEMNFRINDTTTFYGGTGTAVNPYLIAEASQINIISSNDSYLAKDNHFVLLNDIDCKDILITPIGDQYKESTDRFQGSFNGNGYSIKNLIFNNQESLGLFAIIGEYGKINNLNLENTIISVTSDEFSTYHVGALAAVNYGTINNCKVIDSNISVDIATSDHKNESINVYAGGLVGESLGTISYCQGLNTLVDVYVKRSFGNGKISKNTNCAYTGGLIGYVSDEGIVNNCYTNETTTVNCKVVSNYENNDESSPHIVSVAGGIIGNINENSKIANLYSDVTNVEASFSKENTNVIATSNRNNCFANHNILIARRYVASEMAEKNNFLDERRKELDKKLIQARRRKADIEDQLRQAGSDKEQLEFQLLFVNSDIIGLENRIKNLIEEWYGEVNSNLFEYLKKVRATSKDEIDYPAKTYNVEIKFGKINQNNFIEESYNSLNECYESQIYNCNSKYLDLSNAIIFVNGEINESACILGYYNFETNELNGKKDKSKLLVGFYDEDEFIYQTIELNYYVLPNMPKEIIISDDIKQNYDITDDFDNLKLSSNSILLQYYNGEKEDISSTVSLNLESDKEYGINYIVVTYNEFTAKYRIFINCNHAYVNKETIDPTCSKIGYTIQVCSICDHQQKVNFIDKVDHILIDDPNPAGQQKEATCYEEGYTGNKVCKDCNQIIVYGKRIEKTSHNYEILPSNNNKHYCLNENCNLTISSPEDHNYSVVEYLNNEGLEGKIGRLYICDDCDYQYFIENNPSVHTPRIVISEAYTLSENKIVDVYIKLFEATNLSSISLSIKYDENLTVIKDRFELGNIFKISNVNTDYKGLIILQLQDSSLSGTTENGLLYKLSFKLPDNIDKKEFEINISNSSAQISNNYLETINLVLVSGKIKIVNRLPGDVNNDSNVDILDAFLINKYAALKEAEVQNTPNIQKDINEFINKNNFNYIYGDINLDGRVNLDDSLSILQYISGINLVEFVTNKFTIIMNTNDGNNDFLEYEVSYYNELTGKADNKYSELDNYTPTRDGYKFIGWSYILFDINNIDGNLNDYLKENIITSQSLIKYNQTQKNQTLYAIWQKNEIVFDLDNGYLIDEEGNKLANEVDNLYYDGINENVSLNINIEKKINIIYTSQNGTPYSISELYKVITYDFIGWADKNNPNVVIYEKDSKINLQESLGKLELIAVWKQREINLSSLPSDDSLIGYELEGWYYNKSLTDKVINSTTIYSTFVEWNEDSTKLPTITLYSNVKTIKYTVVYNSNNGIGILEDKNSAGEEKIRELYDMPLVLNNNRITKTGYLFKGWSLVEESKIIDYEDGGLLNKEIFNHLNEYNQLTIYAVWEPITYKVVFLPGNANYNVYNEQILTYNEKSYLNDLIYKLEHHNFVYWINKDTNQTYNNKSEVLNLSSTKDGVVYLEAVWEERSYNIYIHSNYDDSIIDTICIKYNSPIYDSLKNKNYSTKYNDATFICYKYENDKEFDITDVMPGKDLVLYACYLRDNVIIEEGVNYNRYDNDEVMDDYSNRVSKELIVDKLSGKYKLVTQYLITDDGRENQPYDSVKLSEYLGFSINELILNGYEEMQIMIDFEMAEIDDGYQWYFVYNTKDIDENNIEKGLVKDCNTGEAVKYRYDYDGNSINTDFNYSVCVFFTVTLKDFVESDLLVVRYGAEGQKDDDWCNRNFKLVITPII